MKNFTRSITDALSQTTNSIESASSKLIPDGGEYWLGDKLGQWSDWLISDALKSPTEVSKWFEDEMTDKLELYRTQRPTRMVRPSNIVQQVTILPVKGSGPKKRSIFEMLEEDAIESIMDAEPLFGSRQTLTSPYEQEQLGESVLRNSTPIIAPFSKYTPTFMWPYTTQEGARYTVHDLGEEELSFPGKSFAEYALGKELDQVGALPGFPVWGDSLLGLGPILIGGSAILILTLAGPALVPGIGKIAGSLVKQTATGLKEIGVATTEGLKKVAKAPFS